MPFTINPDTNNKIAVLGHARHGKDTLAGLLARHYGFTFTSSSLFGAEKAVKPWLEKWHDMTYRTLEDMYADRVNHRSLWYQAIAEYNTPDKARLGRELLSEFDLYVGLRNVDELNALKKEKAFSTVLWIDASKRLPPEPDTSCNITPDDCDLIIDNNKGLKQLEYLVLEELPQACQDFRGAAGDDTKYKKLIS